MEQLAHFYETIGENWFSYHKFYSEIIKKIPDGSIIAEIGCYKGRSTACLGVEIINSRKAISLICVDSWKYVPSTEQPISSQKEFDAVYSEFLKNMKPFENFLSVIRHDSSVVAKSLLDRSLDFAFIDANHTYESVKSDIIAWLPKIKKGGIIAGHDYFTRVHPGVKQAVDEMIPAAQFIPDQNVWWFVCE